MEDQCFKWVLTTSLQIRWSPVAATGMSDREERGSGTKGERFWDLDDG